MALAKKSTMPAHDEALPGRGTPLPITGKHFVNGSNIKQPAATGCEPAIPSVACFVPPPRFFPCVSGQ